MSQIKLLLDEDVWLGLAAAVREQGFDVTHVNELNRKGLSDAEQLAYAARSSRAIITHNAKDFVPLSVSYFFEARSHAGVILTPQLAKGELTRRTLALLRALSAEEIANTVRHLADFT